MKIDAFKHTAQNFFFTAKDEQGKEWELRASFEWESIGTESYPRFRMTCYPEVQSNTGPDDSWVDLIPSPAILKALAAAVSDSDRLNEAELQMLADTQ